MILYFPYSTSYSPVDLPYGNLQLLEHYSGLGGQAMCHSGLINMVSQDLEDLLVLSPLRFWPCAIIIDNTKVKLNMIKGEGGNDYLEFSLNIIAVKHIRGNCLNMNYDHYINGTITKTIFSFWRNLPCHLMPYHLF